MRMSRTPDGRPRYTVKRCDPYLRTEHFENSDLAVRWVADGIPVKERIKVMASFWKVPPLPTHSDTHAAQLLAAAPEGA